MKTNPEISVVITCFNYGHYLEGCLHSVLTQTYDNYEIIVVDDGSTDNTEQIMERFPALPNLRYIRQENSGQASAKNKGIQNAQGRFVAFLDADDLWDKSKLQKQIRLFENPKVGVVYSKSIPIDPEDNLLKCEPPGRHLITRSGMITKWLFFDNFIPFSSSIVRRSCFERFGGFNETYKMGIDWDLWLRISMEYEFGLISEPLLKYRVGHSGQMSKNLEERQRCSDRIMKQFLEDHPGLLSPWTIKKAYAYTYCNRGEYFRKIDKKKSNKFYFDAIINNPLEINPIKGLVKNFLSL